MIMHIDYAIFIKHLLLIIVIFILQESKFGLLQEELQGWKTTIIMISIRKRLGFNRITRIL